MRVYPQDARKAHVEFGRHQLEKTTYKKKKQARAADEQKPACLKRSARLWNTRQPGGQGKADHSTTDVQKESRAKTIPAGQAWCAESPDPTIGAAFRRPDAFALHET